MSKSSFFDPQTIALHTGYQPEAEHGSRAVPIYQTTSYAFQDVAHGAALFNVERGGHIYSRMTNPTVAVLEQRIAALEGGVACVCTSSGMSALFTTFASLCSAGDHIVSAAQIYGSTATLLRHTLKRFGIETTFVDVNDHAAMAAAVQDNTKLLFCESIGNPGLDIADIPALAAIGQEHHLPLVVDATFATPVLNNPIAHGANVVVHSVTKWMGGSGNSVGGAIVDGGNFNWGDPQQSRQFPTQCEPYAPFHGINFYEEFGPSALSMRIRAEAMRDFGATLSPQNAFLLLQGLESLALRMPKHVENAENLAEWLGKHEMVNWVNHPGLESHPNYEVSKRQMNGFGGMLSFKLKDESKESTFKVLESFKIITLAESLGGVESLVNHPVTMSHASIPVKERRKIGVTDSLIRLSIGVEDIEDLIDDITNAIAKI